MLAGSLPTANVSLRAIWPAHVVRQMPRSYDDLTADPLRSVCFITPAKVREGPMQPFGIDCCGQWLQPMSESCDGFGTRACSAVTRWRSTIRVWDARYKDVWRFADAAAWSLGREPGFGC
jgi:hypothetical protein